MYPLKDWLKFKRGYRFHEPTFYSDKHLGLDLMCPKGTPLYAPSDGVAEKRVGKEIGNAIFFTGKHLQRFMHLSSYVKLGAVKEGELIGYTGNTGLTTGPHLHIDISKGALNIYDPNSFLDPETYYMVESIKIKILTPYALDFEPAKAWLAKKGVPVVFDISIFNEPPVWKNYTADQAWVDEKWTDNIGHLAGRSDILVLISENWQTLGILGYAKPEQRLGQFRAYISGITQGTTSKILGDGYRPAQLNIFLHEICHILYLGCGADDRTHELDYSGQPDKLLQGLDYSRFPRFALKGAKRLFKRTYTDKIEERIIDDNLASLFASGYDYWLKKFGWSETIPK